MLDDKSTASALNELTYNGGLSGGATNSPHPWTHVGEQEYATLDGLAGTYIMHPQHWSNVERWFDPEYPEWLVDPVLVHTFCTISKPAIVT